MGFFDRYPYTNWHNVNLDWVLERVKEWGQMVEANDQAFKDLKEANASFKEYVTNYLQDLDVQAAIDDKLDRMFEDGTLGEYLQPYVSPAVTTWLEENITEPEGVVIDSSLTVAGAAADAKAVGDKINEINYRIEDLSPVTSDIKEAIIHCFDNVMFYGDSSINYHDILVSAFYPNGYNYRYLTLNDIIEERGFTEVGVDIYGNIAISNPLSFNCLAFNMDIKRIKYYLYSFRNSYIWYIFRRVNANTYHCIDGTGFFIFTYNSNTGSFDAIRDDTISTKTIIKANTFKKQQEREIILDSDNSTLTIKNSEGGIITINNANIIGLWNDRTMLNAGAHYRNVRVYNA